MSHLQPDQLKIIHAIADEKKKIRLKTIQCTKKLDEWFEL